MRTLAGAALATFSYNCVSQQQEIANNGGVRWNNFASLLQSEDLMLAVNASFQVDVLLVPSLFELFRFWVQFFLIDIFQHPVYHTNPLPLNKER